MATEAPRVDGIPASRAIPAKKVRWADAGFHGLLLVMVGITLGALAWLLLSLVGAALAELDWSFLTSSPSIINADLAGFSYPIRGSLVLMFWTILTAIPVGGAAALYLEKFAPTTQDELRSWLFRIERRRRERVATGTAGALSGVGIRLARFWARVGPRVNRALEVNISNLAAVPSIVYGILGLGIFIGIIGLNKSIFVGGLILGLLVMPVVIIASREAIRAVPVSMEQGAMGLGATKFQAVTRITLPSAIPGMLTGAILGLSRAIGETAPLVVIGTSLFITTPPSLNPLASPNEPLVAMPAQIFGWASDPRQEFQDLAAAGILVLLVILLLINSVAIVLRAKFTRRW